MIGFGLGKWAVAAGAFLLSTQAFSQDAPRVVASVKPVHSLVAGVMAGVGTPSLLIDGSQSPHTFAMRPSHAKVLQSADVVFWVGPEIETGLARPMANLTVEPVALNSVDGLLKLAFREDGPFDAHDHGHGDDDHDDHGTENADAGHDDDEHHHDHAAHEDDDHAAHGDDDHAAHGDDDHVAHGEIDQHLWLDPANAAAMVDGIAAALAAADPARAATYADNGAALKVRLSELTSDVAASLDGLSDRPFVVFHDAYQYFENRFEVAAVGSITVVPDTPPSAGRVAEIRERMQELGAVCVFAEPQFNPRTVEVVAEGTGAHTGVLDPLGVELPAGPDHYFALLRQMAATMGRCLAETS